MFSNSPSSENKTIPAVDKTSMTGKRKTKTLVIKADKKRTHKVLACQEYTAKVFFVYKKI